MSTTGKPTILRARQVLPVTGPVIGNGAVVVSGNAVTAVGPWDEICGSHGGNIVDLGEQILMPGLVNAHCHLDYTMMRRAISPQRSFTEWVRRINALKRTLSDDDYRNAIAKGFEELRACGTTCVANIESFPELLVGMPTPPIRTWWFHEMIDVRHRQTSDETIAGTLAYFEKPAAHRGGFGLSPHAPYTASGSLLELTSVAADDLEMPVAVHVAESREEWDMFRNGRGELYEFMLRLGRWMHDCHKGNTPLAHLAAHARLGPRWLLVHMNELDDSDIELLARIPRGQRPGIVHCPGSHAYFRHGPFRLEKLMEIGMNVCLGTDSLASTHSLSLLDEMRTLARQQPWLHAPEIIAMGTVNGALALGIDAGKIAPGALADLIAIPHAGKESEVHAAVLDQRAPVGWMMIDGKILP